MPAPALPLRPLLVLGAVLVSLPVVLLLLLPQLGPSALLDPELAAAKRPLWLIAHPDDEALFFSPSIVNLLALGKTGHILCLSTGDAEGHGLQRAQELVRSCDSFGIERNHCVSLNDDRLPDSMQSNWQGSHVLDALEPWLAQWQIDAIITFDDYGVSGHVNHRALPAALASANTNLPHVFTLQSSSLLVKFSNILSLPLSAWQQYRHGPLGSSLLLSSPAQVKQSKQAFEHHVSQAVWFRTLYCHFSKYLWWNELRRLGNSLTLGTPKIEL